MKDRMIVCDLDGTLLDSSGGVTDRTRAVVGRVQEAGHTFVIATARPVRDTRHVAHALGPGVVAVCGNGSVVFDFAREQLVGYHPLSQAVISRALDALRTRFPGVRLGAERGLDLVLEEAFELPEIYCREARWTTVLEDVLDGRGAGKLMVQLDGAATEYYEGVREVLAGCEVTVSGTGFCEVMNLGVTKASSLERLAHDLGCASADVIAFGDMPNDLPMLAWSGTAVAVANAHPLVIGSADVVTSSNDDDGVAKWLEAFLADESADTGFPGQRSGARARPAGSSTEGEPPIRRV